jgi:hypothetical protein
MVKCLRCPVSYHTPACTPDNVQRVPGCAKGVLCSRCRAVPPKKYVMPPKDVEPEGRNRRQEQGTRAQ